MIARSSLAIQYVMACCVCLSPSHFAISQVRTLEARVIDDQTNQPVENAKVYYLTSRGDLRRYQTNADGVFHLEMTEAPTDKPEIARERMWIQHSKYELAMTDTASVFRNNSPTIQLHLATADKRTVRLGETSIANATVRPIEINSEGVPLPLQELLQTTSNADGEAEIPCLPGGAVGFVEVRAKGLGSQVLFVRGQRLSEIGNVPKDILSLREVGKIRGRLIAADDAMLRNIKLRFETRVEKSPYGAASGRYEVTEFGRDGSFEVPEIASGKVTMEEVRETPIPYQFRRPRLDAMQVIANRTFEMKLPIERLVTAVGYVSCGNRDLVSGVAVTFESADSKGQVTTDVDGKYTVQLLPGEYEFKAFIHRGKVEVTKTKLSPSKWNGGGGQLKIKIPNTEQEFELPSLRFRPVEIDGR